MSRQFGFGRRDRIKKVNLKVIQIWFQTNLKPKLIQRPPKYWGLFINYLKTARSKGLDERHLGEGIELGWGGGFKKSPKLCLLWMFPFPLQDSKSLCFFHQQPIVKEKKCGRHHAGKRKVIKIIRKYNEWRSKMEKPFLRKKLSDLTHNKRLFVIRILKYHIPVNNIKN